MPMSGSALLRVAAIGSDEDSTRHERGYTQHKEHDSGYNGQHGTDCCEVAVDHEEGKNYRNS